MTAPVRNNRINFDKEKCLGKKALISEKVVKGTCCYLLNRLFGVYCNADNDDGWTVISHQQEQRLYHRLIP